jgi:hypothetical protein
MVSSAATRVGSTLDIVDAPLGLHAFDVLDDSDESRSALVAAMDWVASHVAWRSRRDDQ